MRPEQKTAAPLRPSISSSSGLSVSLPVRDYLPFQDEAYKIDLQFERIAINDVFEIDEHYEADMQRKAHILATRPPDLLMPSVAGVSVACHWRNVASCGDVLA